VNRLAFQQRPTGDCVTPRPNREPLEEAWTNALYAVLKLFFNFAIMKLDCFPTARGNSSRLIQWLRCKLGHLRAGENCMPPLRVVLPFAVFMILTAGASGQEVDEASFRNLAKQCQMRASVAASSRAIKIKDEAIAQHQAFNGSRVDRTGRIVFFGHSEAESDQETDGDVPARQIPWRQVLAYWEKLNDKKIGEGAGGALQVWYYPGALTNDPPSVLHRKKMQLGRLLKFISRLDLSQMGPASEDLREALQQSVIRSSISDVAWSAAFISSIMRALPLDEKTEFSYDASHVTYITSAIEQSLRDLVGGEITSFYRACDPGTTKPRVGDLFCYHRHIEGTPHPYAQRGRPCSSRFSAI
jgi:hypothetical protein